jgi:hypothetical protein
MSSGIGEERADEAAEAGTENDWGIDEARGGINIDEEETDDDAEVVEKEEEEEGLREAAADKEELRSKLTRRRCIDAAELLGVEAADATEEEDAKRPKGESVERSTLEMTWSWLARSFSKINS